MPGGSHWRDRRRRTPAHGDPLRELRAADSVRPSEDRALMDVGQTVVFVGCGHEEPCPELARPCSVDLWGPLEILGFERKIWERLPGNNNATLDPTNLISLGSQSNSAGTGQITRNDTVALRVAAVVTQVLPNGNLVVRGTQEVRVNFETRVLQIAGVIRSQDIRSDNEIPYDRIAEARIAYGGRGQLTDMQQPRWGQQIYDIIFPF